MKKENRRFKRFAAFLLVVAAMSVFLSPAAAAGMWKDNSSDFVISTPPQIQTEDDPSLLYETETKEYRSPSISILSETTSIVVGDISYSLSYSRPVVSDPLESEAEARQILDNNFTFKMTDPDGNPVPYSAYNISLSPNVDGVYDYTITIYFEPVSWHFYDSLGVPKPTPTPAPTPTPTPTPTPAPTSTPLPTSAPTAAPVLTQTPTPSAESSAPSESVSSDIESSSESSPSPAPSPEPSAEQSVPSDESSALSPESSNPNIIDSENPPETASWLDSKMYILNFAAGGIIAFASILSLLPDLKVIRWFNKKKSAKLKLKK